MREDGFAILNQHVNVSRETFEKLSLYYDLLLKWQSKVNLISPDTIDHIWHRHFLDSLQLIPLIPDTTSPLIDMGSGAGFPGLAIAIATGKEVNLIESDMKKSIFLREVGRITGANITVHNSRIEHSMMSNAGVIFARALSELSHLLELSSSYVSRETICLFHKGKNYAMEIEQAKKFWQFECEIFPSVTDESGVILKLSAIKRQEIP